MVMKFLRNMEAKYLMGVPKLMAGTIYFKGKI
jgi:hypothetical protein